MSTSAEGKPPLLMHIGGFLGSPSWATTLVLIGTICCFYVGKKLLDYFYHPLYKHPGPWIAGFSNFQYCATFLSGRQPETVLRLHEKYGSIVRVAPNELSFNSAQSWKDIYGPRKGHQPFLKSDFYDGGNFAAEAHSIVSVRDPAQHSEMRKYLASAFSDRALKDQEYLIAEVVDQLIEKVGEEGKQGTNLVMWFNLATFDIIGRLAFGETFGGVASGTEHQWVSTVIKSMTQAALADCFKRFPMLATTFKALFPGFVKKISQDTARHERYTLDLIRRRLDRTPEQNDIMSAVLDNSEKANLSVVQLAAHASDFVIAGSETTATALSCVTYYLLRKPDIQKKLRDEIRTTFKSYDDINAHSTIPLKYLQAVALEGMRIYPPLPLGLPRVVPPGGGTVDGHSLPAGTIVATNPFAASLSSANFTDPYTFTPERWLESNQQDILEASQPFSLGARSCLGRSIGWMELRTILAKLHFTYDLELIDPGLDWQRDSEMHTLWKKPVLNVRVLPRAD